MISCKELKLKLFFFKLKFFKYFYLKNLSEKNSNSVSFKKKLQRFTQQRGIELYKEILLSAHLDSNNSSFLNSGVNLNVTDPNENSQIILAHIDEVDDEDGFTEAQVKKSHELYDYNEEYSIDSNSTFDYSNQPESNTFINRIIDNSFNQEEEKIGAPDGKQNKEENPISTDEDTFQSSTIHRQSNIENAFNISSEIVSFEKNETEHMSVLHLKEDKFENIDILKSSTLTANVFSTNTKTIQNSTSSIAGIPYFFQKI